MHYNDRWGESAGDVDPGTVLDRLSSQFGEDAIRPLVQSFADMLTEALTALDAGHAQAEAHRVAGVAGTLGFSGVSRLWRAREEDGASETGALRSASADALRLIAERYGYSAKA